MRFILAVLLTLGLTAPLARVARACDGDCDCAHEGANGKNGKHSKKCKHSKDKKKCKDCVRKKGEAQQGESATPPAPSQH